MLRTGCAQRLLHAQATGLHLGVVKGLANVVDGAAGHRLVFQQRHPLGGAAGASDLLNQGHQRVAVGHAQGVGDKARVFGPAGLTGGFTEAGKLAVVAHGQQHGAVCGCKLLVGHQAGVAVALGARHGAGVQKARRLVGQNGHANVEQSHVNVLALAGAVAHLDGRQNGAAGINPGEKISERHAHAHGAAAGLMGGASGDAHHAAHGLNHQVVAGAFGIRAVLAKAGN